MPLIMIRFNPDAFVTNSVKYRSCFKDGQVKLLPKKTQTHKYESIEYRLKVLEEHIVTAMQY